MPPVRLKPQPLRLDKALYHGATTLPSPNPMFDHLLEKSHQWPDSGFGGEILKKGHRSR